MEKRMGAVMSMSARKKEKGMPSGPGAEFFVFLIKDTKVLRVGKDGRAALGMRLV
jgi:hypothetical protein